MGITVFFFIVVCIIVTSVKSASSANERNKQQRQQMQQQRKQYQQRPYVQGRPAQTFNSNGRYSGQTVEQASGASKKMENAQKQQSTLEYLEKKARADQLQHQREMQEDFVRRERASEGRNIGGRYMSGDPVPQGAAICKCGYCGAENVVSAYSRTGYKCYFCWENIN